MKGAKRFPLYIKLTDLAGRPIAILLLNVKASYLTLIKRKCNTVHLTVIIQYYRGTYKPILCKFGRHYLSYYVLF